MIQKIKTWWASECRTVMYIKSRLAEKSTWMGIAAAIASASGLNPPFNYAGAAVGVIIAVMPTSKKNDADS